MKAFTKKKTKLLIMGFFIFLLLISVFFIWFFNSYVANKNEILVTANSDIDINKVKILGENNVIHFEDGITKEKVEKGYGPYNFKVYYNNEKLFDIRTYRYNRNDNTKYTFKFIKGDTNIELEYTECVLAKCEERKIKNVY